MKRFAVLSAGLLLLTSVVSAAVAAGERRVGVPGRGSRGPGAEQTVEGSAGGIRWTMPASWQVGPPQPMRAATYTIPAAAGSEAGSCGVFYFGKNQGGTVDDNLTRWVGQFEGATAPTKAERTIAGLKVHTISVSGTYLAPSGPSMQSQGKKPGWTLSGAIVEAPEGLVFFKAVGPTPTMQKAQADIEALLKSIVKAGATKA
ncbi:MAG TPA: hypothetical protein VKG23_09355 [Thermoanaerobaculia bacterium]|nr:hypothetical protein [Thermoanaerobaculia bacterium]